jgi:hypothetical protein
MSRSHDVSRRAFLEGAAAAAGLVVMPRARLLPRLSPAAASLGSQPQVGPSGATLASYSSVDGLLNNFVSGTIRSVGASALSVDCPAASRGPITISLTDHTEVCSRALVVAGDASSCAPGDRIKVGTSVDSAGRRSARWLIANPVIARVRVTQLTPGGFVGDRLDRHFASQGQTMTVTLTEFSKLGLPAGYSNTPRVGDLVNITGSSNSPSLPATEMWALGGGVVVLH